MTDRWRPACNTPNGYEPPTADPYGWYPAPPRGEYKLADGILGFAVQFNDLIEIRIVLSTEEGRGHMARFIESLSPRCVFTSVISPRLRGMLQRRGWRMEEEYEDGHAYDIWYHPKHVHAATR